MSDEDTSPTPPGVPPGYSQIEISADEMDYLQSYWELRDHGDIFAWGAKLLYDLSKLDQAGWRLALVKADVDEITKQVHYDLGYRQVVMLMRWLGPNKDGWARLPKPEVLDRVMKVEEK